MSKTRNAGGGGGIPPSNTVAPVISGTAVVGQTLSSTTGTWIGTPIPTYTYQWYRGANPISGATSSTYTLVQADATFSVTCVVTATNPAGIASATSNALTITDADAQAFFTASGLTGTTNQSAINKLVVDMKGYGIWTKMKAIYPIIGGTAALHKWNLKDPQDTNAAFRLVFFGGYTHSSTGMAGNGTNGYANTFLVPDTVFSVANNVHLSVYSRTNAAGLGDIDMGGYNGSQVGGVGALLLGVGWNNATRGYLHQGTEINFTNLNSLGFYIGTRIGSAQKIFKNTTLGVSVTSATALKLNYSVAISGAFSSGWGGGVDQGLLSAKEYAFISIGDGLTDTEAANFYTAVNAYQVALSRNV